MAVEKQVELNEVDTITVKFAGDSGDGIQLTGDQFGNITAFAGNDLLLSRLPIRNKSSLEQRTVFPLIKYNLQLKIYTLLVILLKF